jgi:hypothetical protein
MEYTFDFGTFFIGMIILLVGAAFMRWHQAIANNLGSGVMSYDRYKLWALATCVLGFLVMLNLHWFILGNLFLFIFKR